MQKVVKKGDEKGIIHQYAWVVGSVHFGINATWVSERFWWPTMSEDIRHTVRICEQ